MIRNLSQKESNQLLVNNHIGFLGYVYRQRPYVVPISYYFDGKNAIIGYANEGHKIRAMRSNNAVSLQVSEIKSINHWKSMLAHGSFKELSGTDAKSRLHDFSEGIKKLILKKEDKDLDFISEFSSKNYTGELPIIFKIHVREITGKKSSV